MARRHWSRHLDHTSLAEDIYWHRLLSREQRLRPWGRNGPDPAVRDALMERAYAIADRYQRMKRRARRLVRQSARPAKLTDAQQRAVAEWQRRMGEAMWFPHFIDAVFPQRSNQEAGLRASVRRLAREGRIFHQESDGRATLIRETPASVPWQAHDAADCDLPF